MKPHINLSKVHFRRADKPHYKLKLSCGIACATGLSFASHVFDYSMAAIISMILNAIVAIFWIWE